MSSAVISTSAAQGRFFVLNDETEAEVCPGKAFPVSGVCPAGAQCSALSIQPELDRAGIIQSAIKNQQSKILASVTPASRLEVCPAPEMVSSGISAIDSLTGGLPRGCLTEICGPASSGRTTFLLAALAAATRLGEVCAVVDAGDALDPQSAADAGVDLDRMLWVRCGEINTPQRHRGTEKTNLRRHPERSRFSGGAKDLARSADVCRKNNSRNSEYRLEQLLRAANLLLESGGFGLIALDLADLPPQIARRIPLTTWFRFRRVVEHTATVFLVIERQSIAGSCSSLLIKLAMSSAQNREFMMPTHAQLLTGLEIKAEVVRSRMDRKPVRSAGITFASKTAWAG